MKKILNFLKNIIIIAYILLIIFVTICLISYNDFQVTQLGQTTLLPVIDEDLKPDFTVGDLLIIQKNKLTDVKEGDKVFFYRKRFGEVTVNFAPVTSVQQVSNTESTFTVEGDYKFSSSNFIGKVDTITVIPKVGGVLSVLQSKWGFLFLGVFPSLVAFLYTLHSVVTEVIGTDDEEKTKKRKKKKTTEKHSKEDEEEKVVDDKKEMAESAETVENKSEEIKEEKTEEVVTEKEIKETVVEKEEPKEKEDAKESTSVVETDAAEEKQAENTQVVEQGAEEFKVQEEKREAEEVQETKTEEQPKQEEKTDEEKRRAAIEAKMKSMTEEEKRALIKAKLDSMTDEEKRALIEAKRKKLEAEKNKKDDQ